MSRWIFVSLYIICLFCVIRAFPQSGSPSNDATNSSNIESALNEALASLQKGWQKIVEDPGLNKLVQDGQKMVENAAASIQSEAAKIMPKTD